MHTTCKSLKVTVGALAIASAALGLTACGGHGRAPVTSRDQLMGATPGSSSVHFEAGNAVK
jgi:hypothetical protein